MGLDFSHGAANWSYGGFSRFREKLGKEIGIELRITDYFDGTFWETVTDPITPLLNHSDCDGELTPSECAEVAPRLRELIAKWKDDDYDKIQALELADSMEECAKNNENLIFQ